MVTRPSVLAIWLLVGGGLPVAFPQSCENNITFGTVTIEEDGEKLPLNVVVSGGDTAEDGRVRVAGDALLLEV